MLSSALASSPALVIGAGSSVVTWDCRHEEPSESEENLKSFIPFPSSTNDGTTASPRIADLAWNHNGQVLACCSTASSLEENMRKNIVLMSSHSGSVLDSFRHTDTSSDPSKNQKQSSRINTGPSATCVAFGGKSRYLCIGDQQGDICLWDLKKQSRVRQFKSKKRQPCLQACLDPTATYVCALSAQTFTLYHLRQATFAKQWSFSGHNNSNTGGWNQFRFSPLQPSLMALGDNVGRIQLHDGLDSEKPHLVCGGGHTTHASTASSLLPHHASPITGLAFSTQNSKLLANCRSNGILEFVDTSTGEVIHHQQTGGNASALAFQGVSCVVGTETGEVQVYDLRKMMQQFGKAVTTYQMPNGGPITTLEFAPIPKASTTTTTAQGRMRTRSSSPPSRRPSGSSAGNMGLSNAVSFDLESRASMTSYQEPPLLPNASSLTNADFKDLAEDRKQAAMETPGSSASAHVVTMPAVAAAPATTAQAVSAAAEAPRIGTATSFPNRITNNSSDELHQSSSVLSNPPSAVAATQPRSNPPANIHTASAGARPNSQPLRFRSASFSNASGGNINATNPNSAFNNIINNNKNNHIFNNNNNGNRPTGSKGPSPEVAAFLQNMVRQELQEHVFDLKEEMNSSIRNLHVDMIRQFQQQSVEMMSFLRKQQTQIDQLLQENEFLREQNATLHRQQQQSPGRSGATGKNGYH